MKRDQIVFRMYRGVRVYLYKPIFTDDNSYPNIEWKTDKSDACRFTQDEVYVMCMFFGGASEFIPLV